MTTDTSTLIQIDTDGETVLARDLSTEHACRLARMHAMTDAESDAAHVAEGCTVSPDDLYAVACTDEESPIYVVR